MTARSRGGWRLREGAKLAPILRRRSVPAGCSRTILRAPPLGRRRHGPDRRPDSRPIRQSLTKGVKRLQAIGFLADGAVGPWGAAGQEIAGGRRRDRSQPGWSSVIVRPARWRDGGSARSASYLIKHLRCSVLVAQTEISDDQFARLTGIRRARLESSRATVHGRGARGVVS